MRWRNAKKNTAFQRLVAKIFGVKQRRAGEFPLPNPTHSTRVKNRSFMIGRALLPSLLLLTGGDTSRPPLPDRREGQPQALVGAMAFSRDLTDLH